MKPPDVVVAPLLDPAVVLRSFYLAASALILFIQAVPPLSSRFLAYGSRATQQAAVEPRQPSEKRPAPSASGSLDLLLDHLATFRVPHGYFAHFYVVSVLCSLAWWYWWLSPMTRDGDNGKLQLVWLLMLGQGSRRLWESFRFRTKSKSQMWAGHYLLGLLFYLTVNIAIWIEIANPPWNTHQAVTDKPGPIFAVKRVTLSIWFLAQVTQWLCHLRLYELRTEDKESAYKLPSGFLFSVLMCPHYTMEVIIYACMSVLAAPSGRYVNWTLASATVFVAVNLGVTSSGTKDWYTKQFGGAKIQGRKRMVPGIW